MSASQPAASPRTPAFAADLRTAPGCAIIDMQGVLDEAAAPVLNQLWEHAEEATQLRILLNFGAIALISSQGIALLVQHLGRARKAGITLQAFGLNEHYCEIFRITRLCEFIRVWPDEAEALAGLP